MPDPHARDLVGYGPDRPMRIKVTTRDIPPYRDPGVILIDQLKEIWIDGELDGWSESVSQGEVVAGDALAVDEDLNVGGGAQLLAGGEVVGESVDDHGGLLGGVPIEAFAAVIHQVYGRFG